MTGRPAGAAAWEETVTAAVRAVTGIDVPAERGFFDAGLTSAALVAVHERLRPAMGPDVPVTAFFRHPTARRLARHLAGGPDLPVPAPAGAEPAGPGPAVLPAPTPLRTAAGRRAFRARLRQGGGGDDRG